MLDCELFLLKTLKDEQLSKTTCSEKDAILQKLKALQDDYPQLRHNLESDLHREFETTPATLTTQQSKQLTGSDDSSGKIKKCFQCRILVSSAAFELILN